MTTGADQLPLIGAGVENRSLFSENFLESRLPEWGEFRSIEIDGVLDALQLIWEREGSSIADANEAQTEDRLIKPILDVLGFERTVQADMPMKGGRRIPDYALYGSGEDRLASESLQGVERFERAVALAEAKRFDAPLDRKQARGSGMGGPEAQLLDYMWRTRVRWAMLTNGREWRLYGQSGDLVEAAHLAILDLPAIVEAGDREQLRYFLAFFGAGSFRADSAGSCFLDRAFAESEANARRVGNSIRDQVFAAVPKLASGLIGDEPVDDDLLEKAFSNALVILYRLLFCLYAESRELLPVSNPHYARYGLAEMRRQTADPDSARSMRSSRLYNDLNVLFDMLDEGDEDLKINEYNGGLFSSEAHPWLDGRTIPDPLMRDALVSMFMVDGESVDYRDLSIRHLGTMYEQLLDYRLEQQAGRLRLVSSSGRHDSGSYFTPEAIVDAIVERTLDPLLVEKSDHVDRLQLTGDAAMDEFLKLRICDPAMGSGHFLVSAAAYVARYIVTDPSQDCTDLDEQLVRRNVAEQCLYGVDLNPMAVELARLALWLATVDDHRPLTFLNNLRVGNTLVGANIDDLRADILFERQLDAISGPLVDRSSEIKQLESDNASSVHAKEAIAESVAELRAELEEFADSVIEPYFPGGAEAVFHWELEFPDVFFRKDGAVNPAGGFDAIVGNPPYIRIQSLSRELAKYCRKWYPDSAFGSFDAYTVFIDRCFGLLGAKGRLGFIVPNKFLKLDMGERLRGRFAEARVVEEVVDFGDIQVFEGATNYTCLVVLANGMSLDSVAYRRAADPSRPLTVADIERTPTEHFEYSGLNRNPWVFVPPDERKLMLQAEAGAERLADVTERIFQGLITSADPVYILEDRGLTRGGRRVFSKQLHQEFVLEDQLLHPLASGSEAARWAVVGLTSVLLFPYRPDAGGKMCLIDPDELERFPRTREYLKMNEDLLRGRERGKMDREGWFGFVYPKSLGLHDLPKLVVPRLCDRLRVAVDPDGEVYLDNVDVNGIIPNPDRMSLSSVAGILNSKLLDYVFKRHSVPFRGAFYSANKQFIADLPIRVPEAGIGDALEDRSRKLRSLTNEADQEREEFRAWLGGVLGRPIGDLKGKTKLAKYDEISEEQLIAVLRGNRRLLEVDPTSRAVSAEIRTEYQGSIGKLSEVTTDAERLEREVDEMVYELYEMPSSFRKAIEAEY